MQFHFEVALALKLYFNAIPAAFCKFNTTGGFSSEHNLSQLPTTLHILAAPSPVVTAVSTTSTAA